MTWWTHATTGGPERALILGTIGAVAAVGWVAGGLEPQPFDGPVTALNLAMTVGVSLAVLLRAWLPVTDRQVRAMAPDIAGTDRPAIARRIRVARRWRVTVAVGVAMPAMASELTPVLADRYPESSPGSLVICVSALAGYLLGAIIGEYRLRPRLGERRRVLSTPRSLETFVPAAAVRGARRLVLVAAGSAATAGVAGWLASAPRWWVPVLASPLILIAVPVQQVVADHVVDLSFDGSVAAGESRASALEVVLNGVPGIATVMSVMAISTVELWNGASGGIASLAKAVPFVAGTLLAGSLYLTLARVAATLPAAFARDPEPSGPPAAGAPA